MLLAKFRRHLGRFGQLLRRPVADQWLVLKAFVLLGHSRYLIRTKGLKGVEPMLGNRLVASPAPSNDDNDAVAERIGWAVSNVSIYTPWTSNCFSQALTAKRLLARHDIAPTVYFGATRETAGTDAPSGAPLAAHAWVRVGDRIITGGSGHELYCPIVWFGTGKPEGTQHHHGEP